jgi:hypothetical protein
MKKSPMSIVLVTLGGLVVLVMLCVLLVAYRQSSVPLATGIYLARSTEDGVCRSAPALVDNAAPYSHQYVPQVQGTPTQSATATPTCQDYSYSLGAGTMISGTYDIGNHCDICATVITLPFTVDLYGQSFTTAQAGSKGYLAFGTAYLPFDVQCLPFSSATYVMAPFWVDQYTAPHCTTCGIYTATLGTAPNRTFIVEYRTLYFNQQNTTHTLDYEIQMQEGQSTFKYVYGLITSYANTDSALTIGVQKSTNPPVYTRYYCDPSGHTPPAIAGQQLTWTYTPCGTATATVTRTIAASSTPTVTPGVPTSTVGPPEVSSTPSRTPTSTRTPIPTSTSCPVQFTDVPPGSTFYDFIRCLACRGIVSGYPDGTFRPNNNVTRGQLAKIVSNAAGFSDPARAQLFEDVPPGSTFYDFIQRIANPCCAYIGGYPCGGAGEPCVPPNNLPYFRPNNNATRGQIAKILSNVAGFQEPVTGQTFEDVPPGSTFYDFIERLASRGVMSGYPCGGPSAPCVPPTFRPYFRPNNNATRGQSSKMVASTFFPGCETPG